MFIYAKLRAQLRTHYARTERRQHVHPLFDNLTKPPPVARKPPRTNPTPPLRANTKQRPP